MTYHSLIRSQCRSDLTSDCDVYSVKTFLATHAAGLINASEMLGGASAVSKVVELIEAMQNASKLTRAQHRQLRALHDLLALQNTDDPYRVESALFACISPTSPVVDDICLLADSLQDLLNEIAVPTAGCRIDEPAQLGRIRPDPRPAKLVQGGAA